MEYFETCVFLKYLKKINQNYLAIENKASFICLNSFIHRLIKDVFEAIKIGFRFSLFGRLTEIEPGISSDFFETSKIIKVVLSWMRNFKDKLTNVSTGSIFFASIIALKSDFSLKPLKAGGIIVIVAVTTNLVLAMILERQLSLVGWVVRGLLLFIGISGLFCNSDWEGIKRTSKINKILTKGKG